MEALHLAKLTLTNGIIFEGTTEEIFAITERFNGVTADEPIAEVGKEITHKGINYALADRKAQEGDVVVFKASTSSLVTNGKPYGPTFVNSNGPRLEVDVDNDTISVYFRTFSRNESNVLVYTPKVDPKEAIFTQVGRKPNEYRKGDIVLVTGKRTGKKFYGEIVKHVGDDFYRFLQFGDSSPATDRASDMSPIAFVESRLDRN